MSNRPPEDYSLDTPIWSALSASAGPLSVHWAYWRGWAFLFGCFIINKLNLSIADNPELNCPLDNDLWLLSFLRMAHFYPEGALQKVGRNSFSLISFQYLISSIAVRWIPFHIIDRDEPKTTHSYNSINNTTNC